MAVKVVVDPLQRIHMSVPDLRGVQRQTDKSRPMGDGMQGGRMGGGGDGGCKRQGGDGEATGRRDMLEGSAGMVEA